MVVPSGAIVLLLLAGALQITNGARITRGLIGSGYGGGSGGGGGSCKFWCESGGGQYHCCQTPQQTALQTGAAHAPQTHGGYGTQGINNFANNFANNFGNNLAHHGSGGSQLGGYGTSNNFAQQGNSFGSQGSYRPQGSYGSQNVNQGFRPGATLVILGTSSNLGHQGNSFGQQGGSFGSQGSYRPQVTHGSQNVNQGFRPVQGGYGSNNNQASVGSGFNNFASQNLQNTNQPQGHPSNFVSNPSIVTPLGHNDAISTHNRPTNQGTVGNTNNGFNPNTFAFQGSNQGPNQGINQGSNQGSNQGPNYPFDIRIRPQKPKST